MPAKGKKLCSKHGLQPSPCPGCAAATAKRIREKKRIRPWYQTREYRIAARACCEAAYMCWICGEGPRIGDPWTADHYEPRGPNTVLLEAHRTCNSRRGNREAPPHREWLRIMRYFGDPRLEILGWME